MRALPLLIGGYLAEVVILVNWMLVLHERRGRWFAVHLLAMAALVVGWLTLTQYPAAGVNGAWLVLSALWYAASHRGGRLDRRRRRNFVASAAAASSAPRGPAPLPEAGTEADTKL